MSKNVRLALIIILSAALLCVALSVIACNGNDIVELRVENAKISFMKGDEFETGEGFAVYAVYKDGKSVDVTNDVEVRQESGMDMNVAGDYQITVVYSNKRTIYVVYVNDKADVLRKIELDTSNVNKQYNLGDKIAFEGLVLNLTYENAQGVRFPVNTTSLKDFDVTVTSESGAIMSDIYTSLGKFTVTVSQNNVKGSFEVTVDGVNISTVQSAIAVGGYYKGEVVSGELTVQGAMLHYGNDPVTGEPILQPGEPYTSSVYEYKFGDNYTYFKETFAETPMEYHCGTDAEGFFVTYLEGGTIKPSNRNNAAMMDGAPILLWYSSATEYGLESALNNLYAHALSCSNDDLTETADKSTRMYSFRFSGLEFRDSNADYYETTVSFTLGEDYAVTSVLIDQYYYENNRSLSGMDGYVPSFTTDAATGKTSPGPEYTYRTIISATQKSGERTDRNEYSREMFKVASYDLMYNGEILTDESVLELDAGGIYKLQIVNVLPTTANFSVDMLYFDYEGNYGSADFWLSNEDFNLSSNGSDISLSARRGGTWTLIFRTEKTVKYLTVNVTGEPPKEMKPKLYNSTSKSFYDGNEKSLSIGGEAYFYGSVNSHANAAQTATVNSDNAEYATITAAKINGVDCWKFTATQAGTYQVEVVSSVAALTRCIFTFTVSETADFAELLSGTYTAQDRAGDIYRVTFTMSGEDSLSGTVLVTRTPTDEGNNLLEEQTVSQTLSVYVDGNSIIVDNDEANSIWVEFEVDANNKLNLIDQRGGNYPLEREE